MKYTIALRKSDRSTGGVRLARSVRKEYELIKTNEGGLAEVMFRSHDIAELYDLVADLGEQIVIYPDDELFSEMIHMQSTEDILELVA